MGRPSERLLANSFLGRSVVSSEFGTVNGLYKKQTKPHSKYEKLVQHHPKYKLASPHHSVPSEKTVSHLPHKIKNLQKLINYKQTKSPGVPSGFFKRVRRIPQKPVGRKIVTPMRQVQAAPRLPAHYYPSLPSVHHSVNSLYNAQPAPVSPSMRGRFIQPLPAIQLSPMVSLPTVGGHHSCMSNPWLCQMYSHPAPLMPAPLMPVPSMPATPLFPPNHPLCESHPWLCAGFPHPTAPTAPTIPSLLPPDHHLCESQPQLCQGFPHATPPAHPKPPAYPTHPTPPASPTHPIHPICFSYPFLCL